MRFLLSAFMMCMRHEYRTLQEACVFFLPAPDRIASLDLELRGYGGIIVLHTLGGLLSSCYVHGETPREDDRVGIAYTLARPKLR